MAKLVARPTVGLEVQFTISEEEARALDALSGYGDDKFIEVFKQSLGEAYLRNHEQGLRTFLTSIRDMMPSLLHRADEARKAFCKDVEVRVSS
jgi:hypothetical protein